MKWPKIIEAHEQATDPVHAKVKMIKEHVRLCVDCDDKKALQELAGLIAGGERPHHLGDIPGFIEEIKQAWPKLRAERGFVQPGRWRWDERFAGSMFFHAPTQK